MDDLVSLMDVDRLPPHRRRTPMTAEDKAAFLRAAAAADPASVTRADKNQIFGQPPPEEEDRLCQEKIGMTMDELRRKIMGDPDTLTELECDIIRYGATYAWGQSPVSTRRQWSVAFLPDEEYRLARQVVTLLVTFHGDEISRRAELRAKAFAGIKKRRYEKFIQERDEEAAAKWQEEFSQAIKTSRAFNPPPTRLSPEEKALYLRIIADPASVTRADKNQVFEKPPPDEEDRLCKEKVGATMEELRHKALSNPDTLTEDECDILSYGVAKRDKSNGKPSFWKFHLVEDDRELSDQVYEILYTQEDIEIQRRARHRHHDFDAVIEERHKRNRQRQFDERAAKMRATTPRWINHMSDAKLSRWGFVIFRTTYGGETEDEWTTFKWVYEDYRRAQLNFGWIRSNNISPLHQPLLVSDSSLEGADVDALRQRFKAMREQNEIPAGIATDCFLIADQAVFDSAVLSLESRYQPKAPGEPDPWQYAFYMRAVNPDYDASVLIPSEGELAGYEGEITIPLPKVFDWLYYCFLAKSEDWETRYKLVKGGPAEMMSNKSPYPAYRSGTEPAELPDKLPPEPAT
ncbi:hypothetical protein HDV63DRAFT_373407 [Trichoderma sp. SZMC 28014]